MSKSISEEFVNDVARHIIENDLEHDKESIWEHAATVVQWSSWGHASNYSKMRVNPVLKDKFVEEVEAAIMDSYRE
jgi:hypothetical protein